MISGLPTVTYLSEVFSLQGNTETPLPLHKRRFCHTKVSQKILGSIITLSAQLRLGFSPQALGLGLRVYTQSKQSSPITVISDSVVIVDLQAFQVLDQTPLEVATARGLDCGVHQAVAPRHAVEVVLLGPETRQKAVPNETPRSGTCKWGTESGLDTAPAVVGFPSVLKTLLKV